MCRDSHITSRYGAMKCAKRMLLGVTPRRRVRSIRRVRPMRLHRFTVIGFVVLASGCGGGQTGDLSGRNDEGGKQTGHNGEFNGCQETREEIGFDEMTESGSVE